MKCRQAKLWRPWIFPNWNLHVIAAEAALRSAQAEEKVQSYRRIKDRRNGRVYFDVVPPEVRQNAHARVQQRPGRAGNCTSHSG